MGKLKIEGYTWFKNGGSKCPLLLALIYLKN